LGIAVLLSLDSPAPDYSAEMATAVGERRQVELPDGTTIELGVNSRLSVNFQGEQRNVHLAYGEAFFQVAHNQQRPFNVTSNGHKITVVGTAFNVNARSDVTKVLLVEGAVRIDPDNADSLLLKPGEQTQFSADQPPTSPTSGNPTIALAWRSGKLVFVDAPLSEVIESFENYHARAITVDPSAARLRVSGVIPIEDSANAMDTLASLLPISIEVTGDTYLIQATP
jgi:transmembrane sensor